MISPTHTPEPFTPSAEMVVRVDQLVPRYPSVRSASLPILHLVQEEFGYVSDGAIEWIAKRLELEPIHIYELVTFYPMFHRKPTGRHHIKVCRTLSCALNGGAEVCEKFKKAFDVGLDEVSEDGEVQIEYVECIASCGTAPVVQINETLYENVSAEKVDEIVKAIRSEAAARGESRE